MNSESVIRIVLRAEDFKQLVSGKVVNHPEELVCAIEGKEFWRFKIQVALGEMTFGVMKHLIEFEAQRAKENPSGDPASSKADPGSGLG